MKKETNSELKSGFTTGSAAAAATSAATEMLITGKKVENVSITTPSGKEYNPKVYDCSFNDEKGESASCYVIKESGDDPDVTAGIRIYSKVSFIDKNEIIITGGEGIGKVTRPGLDQKVGEYAINSVPRKMIAEAVKNVLDIYDISSGVKVEISAPQGIEVAKKTFNPHMGIEGGISIIGTSGIVKPMSSKALTDTIRLDINIQYSEGCKKCVIVPGNYGVNFLTEKYGIPEKNIVLCSNYVGDSIRFAKEIGFKEILFCSHIGKMIKVSGGVLNTHSMYGDRRMEFMCDAYKEASLKLTGEYDPIIEKRITECVSTSAALDILNEINMVSDVSEIILKKSLTHLEKACGGMVHIDCILYENSYGELARSF